MSGHDYPVFFSGGQDRINPCELLFVILLASIGISLFLITVFVYHRSGIYPNYPDSHAFVFKNFGIVTCGHCPAAADIRIIQYGLRVAAVFMITQQRKPVYHQFGMAVNQFVISHPQRVVDGTYAFKVVHITRSEYKLRICAVFRHYSHQFGNGLLVIIAVASQVIGYIEVELFVEYGIIGNLGTCPVAQQGDE